MLSSKVWHGLSGDTLHIHTNACMQTYTVRWGWHTHTHTRMCVCLNVVSPSEAGFLEDMSDSFRALVQRLWEGERDILLFTAQWCLLNLPLQSLTHKLLLHITLDVTLFPFGYFSSFNCLSSDSKNHQTFFIRLTFVQCAFRSPTHKHTHSCSAVRVSSAKTKTWKYNRRENATGLRATTTKPITCIMKLT